MTSARTDASGFLTIQFVLVVAFTLLLLVLAANLIAWQYGRGVVRAALDEGARAGARLPVDAAICEQRARDAVGDLLGGTMGDGVDIRCWIDAGTVVAEADVTFSSWVDPVPDWSFTTRAIAVGERVP
jgi:hypothetical protein